METSGRYEHLLLLGSTGRVGQQLLSQALQRGYRVTALVRDPARLPTNDHARLRVVRGALEDTALLAEILESGVDAVLSTLGVYLKKPATTLTDMTAPVLQAMAASPAKRFVCMSSLGVGDSKGQGGLVEQFVIRWVLRHVLVDKQAQEKLIEHSGLDWSILRPPRIMDSAEQRPYLRWNNASAPGKPEWKISRADAAREMLDLLEDDSSIGQTWHISYPR